MAIPVNSIIEVTVIGSLVGQTTMNVFHYVVDVADSDPNPFTEIGSLLVAHFNNGVNTIGESITDVTPENWTWTRATGQVIHPSRQRRVTQTRQLAGVRGLAEQANVQASITLETDLAGRSQVGGKRMPMTPADSQTGIVNVQLAAALDTLALRARSFLTAAGTGGQYSPVIWHRSPNANPRFNRVTASFRQDTTRVIRRRTVGLGI